MIYNLKFLKKILKNKLLTYFFGLFTLFFMFEIINNPDNNIIVFLKYTLSYSIIKILILFIIIIIGYFNNSLGFLIGINILFLINTKNKKEAFTNRLPDLINRNDILKYKKFLNNEKNNNESKNIKKKIKNKEYNENYDSIKENSNNIKENSNNIKENSNNIKNPFKIQKTKKFNKKIELEDKNINKERKKELLKELEDIEKEREYDNSDTIEKEFKESQKEKRRRLEILRYKNDDSDDESSSSNSSDSGSSSSNSSSNSDKEYDDIPIKEARNHVLNKLRNKLKKKYSND